MRRSAAAAPARHTARAAAHSAAANSAAAHTAAAHTAAAHSAAAHSATAHSAAAHSAERRPSIFALAGCGRFGVACGYRQVDVGSSSRSAVGAPTRRTQFESEATYDDVRPPPADRPTARLPNRRTVPLPAQPPHPTDPPNRAAARAAAPPDRLTRPPGCACALRPLDAWTIVTRLLRVGTFV